MEAIKGPCEQPGGAEPHEPPIIFGGGSLNLTIKPRLVDDGFNEPGSARPFRYRWTQLHDGHLAVVRVVTEDNEGVFSCERYQLPVELGCQLHIWLQQLKPSGGPFDYDDPPDEPQLLVEGNTTRLEIYRELKGPTMSHDFGHPFRYEHPGFDRHFRIAKWQIFSPAQPDDPIFESIEGESFKFYLSFHPRS